jgi:ubiquinone/menaquinone biosynthesis C-methylase UbiE
MAHEHHHKRFNPENLSRLEDPDRNHLFPIDRILTLSGIKPKMTVADIGVGTGYFAIPIAKVIAPATLFAVDVSSEMLDYFRNKLSQPGMPKNIQLVTGAAEGTTLDSASCDIVFLSAVWHEVDDEAQTLAEFARILKPHGRVSIVDWSPNGTRPPGPPMEHRVPIEKVGETLTAKGWNVISSNSLNESIYVVVAERP